MYRGPSQVPTCFAVACASRVHVHTRFDAALYIILCKYGRYNIMIIIHAAFKDEFGWVSDFKYSKKKLFIRVAAIY